MRTLLYFAYGSNMHAPRLRERTPSCEPYAVARLPGYRLCFNKRSNDPSDRSGKCNIVVSDSEDAEVLGVVYRFEVAEKVALDRAEGDGYAQVSLEVQAAVGGLGVYCYHARDTHVDDSLTPYAWYKELVVQGARGHRLPDHYIDFLDSHPAIDDHDVRRASVHFRLATKPT